MNWLKKYKLSQSQSIEATLMGVVNGQLDAQRAYDMLKSTATANDCCVELASMSNNLTRLSQTAARALFQLKGLLGCSTLENQQVIQMNNNAVEMKKEMPDSVGIPTESIE